MDLLTAAIEENEETELLGARVSTFEDQGYMTRDKGLVVHLAGSRLRILLTIQLDRRDMSGSYMICDDCDATAVAGRLKGFSPGCRTSAGWWSDTNDTLRTFLGCSISAAALSY